MELTETVEDKVTILSINGRLDSNSSTELESHIFDKIENSANHFIIDCANLDYITSAGLRVLNKTAKKLRTTQGKLVLCTMADYVKEVFEIAGFDRFLPIVPSREDALAQM
jgi:anti-sigma B factor antagonist